MITLVLGGARSGKSEVAERIAANSAAAVTYVAAGVATDDDMAARIAAHQTRRPPSWSTVDVARDHGGDLAAALAAACGTALVDSLGTWVASQRDFDVDTSGVCNAMAARHGDTILVSDEVGLGVHPATDVGRRFRDALGTVNQQIADAADRVLLVVAGRVLPLDRP